MYLVTLSMTAERFPDDLSFANRDPLDFLGRSSREIPKVEMGDIAKIAGCSVRRPGHIDKQQKVGPKK